MGVVIITAAAGLVGFLIGLSLAGRIAEHKIKEMRLEMNLDANTGRPNDEID